MTANTTKFTATLVTEQTKNAIVALRNETNLSEKELMTLVVDVALAHRDSIIATAAEIVQRNNAERAERKAAAYEALKARLRQARELAKKSKPAKAPKAPKAPKPAKTSAPAPAQPWHAQV